MYLNQNHCYKVVDIENEEKKLNKLIQSTHGLEIQWKSKYTPFLNNLKKIDRVTLHLQSREILNLRIV